MALAKLAMGGLPAAAYVQNTKTAEVAVGRIMGSISGQGGLAGHGGMRVGRDRRLVCHGRRHRTPLGAGRVAVLARWVETRARLGTISFN